MNNLTLKFHISKLNANKPIFKLSILLILNSLITTIFLNSKPVFHNNYKKYIVDSDTSKPSQLFPSSPFKSSFRGMDICSDSSIWISGSKGVIVRGTTNIHPSNNTRTTTSTFSNPIRDVASQFKSVSTGMNKDFRDIVAWDSLNALCMSAGDSGVLLKTTDGGKHWNPVFQDNSKGVFFDDLEFDVTKTRGLLAGDPLSGRKNLYFRITFDSGNTWEIMPQSNWNKITPRLNTMFAASGSSVKIIKFNQLTKNDTTKTEKYELELIIGGGGDSGACIRWTNLKFERNWHHGKPYIHTYYQTFLDLPLYDSILPGYGVYGLTTLIHDEYNFTVFASGGHWKYPNREESNARMLEFRKHKDSQSHKIWNSPFNGLAYNSGVSIGKNNELSNMHFSQKNQKKAQNSRIPQTATYQIISVGTNGLMKQDFTVDNSLPNPQFNKTKGSLKQDFTVETPQSSPQFNIRLQEDAQKLFLPQNLNAVRFDGRHFWIIGSNGQIYCI